MCAVDRDRDERRRPPVPAPAAVVPQAASPIMSPAMMPPSAARLAAPSGLPSVLIATPFGRDAIRAAPRCAARHGPPPGGIRGAGLAARGRPRGLGAGPVMRTRSRRADVGAGWPGCPKPARTDLDGQRPRLVPADWPPSA